MSTGIRVLVCGGPDCTDEAAVFHELDRLDAETRITLVIEGGQRTRDRTRGVIGGADFFACRWSYFRARPGMRFDAEWNDLSHPEAVIKSRPGGTRYNANAGPIRNRRMLTEGKPDLVIAFPGGRGTADMIRQAENAGIPVRRIG